MEIGSLHDLQTLARARRRELGLTQAATSGRASVSRKWLSAFERGATAAELPLVLRLLAALQLRVDVSSIGTDPSDLAAGATTAKPAEDDLIDLDSYLQTFAARADVEQSQ